MALFKVLRGNRSNLPGAKHDGWAYFCTDTGEFFIDYDTGKSDENGPILERKQIKGSGVQLIDWTEESPEGSDT